MPVDTRSPSTTRARPKPTPTGAPPSCTPDDNRDLRAYVHSLLSDRYNVYLAADGADALELAQQCRPDLILSDLMMPRMTGAELCQNVRQLPELASTPFILLTARATTDDRVVGLEEGANDYICKPFSERELLARVSNMISMRQHELRLSREVCDARQIQRTLLPRCPIEAGAFRVEALYEPCGELSGDFFDVIADDRAMWIYLADVTSHGTASAQVTLLVKQIFRELLQGSEIEDVDTLLLEAQRRYAALQLAYDVGIQAVRVDLRDGAVVYASGNAPAALLRGSTGAIRPVVVPPGPGLTGRQAPEPPTYAPAQVQLEPGDALHLFTDGCVEFSSRERRFGTRRLVRVLQALDGSDDWAGALHEALEAERDGPAFDDDLTVLRLRRAA